MSRTPRLSITVLFVSLVAAITAARQASGQPRSEKEFADRHKEIIGGLETIPIDSAELLEKADGLSQKLKNDINDMKLRFKDMALQQNLWGGIGRRTGQRLDFLRHSSGVQ